MFFQLSYVFPRNRSEQKVPLTLVVGNPKHKLNINVKLISKTAQLQNFLNLKIYINDAGIKQALFVKKNSMTDVSWVITESIAICSALLISCIGYPW